METKAGWIPWCSWLLCHQQRLESLEIRQIWRGGPRLRRGLPLIHMFSLKNTQVRLDACLELNHYWCRRYSFWLVGQFWGEAMIDARWKSSSTYHVHTCVPCVLQYLVISVNKTMLSYRAPIIDKPTICSLFKTQTQHPLLLRVYYQVISNLWKYSHVKLYAISQFRHHANWRDLQPDDSRKKNAIREWMRRLVSYRFSA